MYRVIRTTSLSVLVLIAVLGIPVMFLMNAYVDRCPNTAFAQDNPCEAQDNIISAMETDLEHATVVADAYRATISAFETAVASDLELANLGVGLDENNLPLWAIVHVRTRGGIEIFETPDAEARLYAADATLFPHVVGRIEDSEWLYIYYFVDGRLRDHWVPADQTTLLDEQIEELPIVDPDDLPVRPTVVFSEQANMTLRTTSPTSTRQPTLLPQSTSGSPPTILPPPATPSTGS
ncbi:MAG: hypothetical protein L0154_12005 [Chloroflexi bacterium]|nr:hypothetical protein [Chloroflexota bacterium]